METHGNIMNEYRNGKIYRVCDVAYTEFYYGSTTQSLRVRMAGHRASYKYYTSGKLTKILAIRKLFETYGVDKCKIELVENYPCGSRNELEQREGYHIQQNTFVNKVMAGRTKEYIIEYKNAWAYDNADHVEQMQHIKYEKNKETIKTRSREYTAQHKDEVKEQNKLYYERNKAALSLKHREWYKANADVIRARRTEALTCPVCGDSYVRERKAKHELTRKHLDAIILHDLRIRT